MIADLTFDPFSCVVVNLDMKLNCSGPGLSFREFWHQSALCMRVCVYAYVLCRAQADKNDKTNRGVRCGCIIGEKRHFAARSRVDRATLHEFLTLGSVDQITRDPTSPADKSLHSSSPLLIQI